MAAPAHAALGHKKLRRTVRVWARGGVAPDPYRVLDIPRNSSKAEVRAAYLERMKLYHPDVSMEEDAAEVAVQLNVAYQQLMEGGKGKQGAEGELLDIFDFPEAEPSCMFINPFSCNVNPLDWRTLQEIAEGRDEPTVALSQNGVFAPESAVHYLTPAQLEAVQADMAEMEGSLSYEVTAWVLTDKLGRARRANNRMPVSRS